MNMNVLFDRAAELYDRTRSFPRETMEKAVRILENELKDFRLVLDVGVGTGRFAEPLQILGFEVVGVDVSTKMMKKAIDKGVRNLVYSDACHLPFSDSTFDASLTIHVLHLIRNWSAALFEITRVTRHTMLTVLVEDSNDTPRDLYKRLMRKYGYDYSHPGMGEWDFKYKVKPTKSILIDEYQGDAESALSSLREKAYSHQWNAPEEVHRKAMSELQRTVSGTTYTKEVYLYKWDINTIRSYLQKSAQYRNETIISDRA
jgi:ubiquinone/menaquinone biosynthesis C-methylase UbiE